MSYTEYLSRKKAAAPVILDIRPKMDASTYTRHTRVVAAANIYAPTKSVVGNIRDMVTPASRDRNAFTPATTVQLSTGQGGRIPDGSTFSDYAAGRAAEMDYKDGPPLGKVTLNSDSAGSLSGCGSAKISVPIPNLTITAASYNSTTGVVTFTATNTYVVGDRVSISGVTGGGADLNSVFNQTNAVVTSANSTTFTITALTNKVAVAGPTVAITSATNVSGGVYQFNSSSNLFVGYTNGNLVATFGFTPSTQYNLGTPTSISNAGAASFKIITGSATSADASDTMGFAVNTSLSLTGAISSGGSRLKVVDKTYPNADITTNFPSNPEVFVSRNASNNTKDIIQCKERFPEPHTGPLAPPIFVDNTISVNGVFGSGMGDKGVPKDANGNAIPDFRCPRVVHTHPEITPRRAWGPRPTKGAGGLFVSSITSPEHPYKAGGLVPSDHLKYVEKHHGNDLSVNPRRYPKTPYQIPDGTVAHLRINEPNRVV